MRRSLTWALALVLASVGLASAQGVQTSELSGTVRSQDGQTLPGVTVTVKSSALQGVRTATTDNAGGYIVRALPPGAYSVSFELSGMNRVEQNATVALGTPARVDATLSVKTVEETVVVTAEAPTALTTTQVGANYKGATIDTLATSRTLAGIAELAPGLTNDTPNGAQVAISGGFAYDNVFMIDGVDVNDNLFGSPNNLFIEDAIDETQVLTSGISAEYGRFSGGVVNAITKHGGNNFSGSFRTDFTNSAWSEETPFEKANGTKHASKTNPEYQATLGGPIVKDRLWFFLAGRKAATDNARVLPDTGIPTDVKQDDRRIEGKLTGTLSPNHNVSATFFKNATDQTQPSFGFASSGLRSIDPATIGTRSLPNSLFALNYNGVLSSNLFIEAQYSQKKFKFENAGGSGTDVVADSPFLTLGVTPGVGATGQYNAQYFDATDPEERNNRQFAGALSYFLTTSGFGRHDFKLGYENFRTTRTGGNSQSPTNFVFYDDYLPGADGKPALDSTGHLIPVFVPGTSLRTDYLATRGARIDITTNSFYLNDKWQIDPHWLANLGFRYEMVKSNATGGIIGVDTNTIVPRLALSYDIKADGRYKLEATYAHYAGKYQEGQIGNNTNVGNPSYLYQLYVGPAGQGRNFAPGFDSANYVTFGGGFPTANVTLAPNLSSPVSKEFTVSAKTAIGQRGGYASLTYVHRNVTNFIDDFVLFSQGTTTVIQNGTNFGTFDNKVYGNTDVPKRKYDAVELQSHYRLTPKWDLTGHYTLMINNDGNFTGEATNQPAASSVINNYPEIYVADRDFPEGHLPSFQRHKVRAWTTYDLGLGGAGDVSASLLWRYDSALTYSLTAANVPFSAIQLSHDPGYATLPLAQTLYFGDRGSQFFNGAHKFDFSLNYSIPVVKSVRPYFKFEVVNLFNNQNLVSFNTSITRDRNGPVDANGLAVNYVKGANFGKATSASNFPVSYLMDGSTVNSRAFSFALGFRF